MTDGAAPNLRLVPPVASDAANATMPLDSVPAASASGPYLDDLFAELLEMDESARIAAIPALCRGDAVLETELRALLAADAPPEPSSAPSALPSSAPPPTQSGAPLDRYRLFQKLGSGASASVWQAWDTHLRTWTALKLLKADLASTRRDAMDVVLHEARAASQIISDHVVRVREAGRLDDGTYFVDMQLCAEYRKGADGQEELVVGSPLSREVGHLTPVEAARLVADAARGVDAAHRVGVLHRDLKPANLLLQPVSRRVLVTDFGLALARVAPEAGPLSAPTETVTIQVDGPAGVIVGTPSWMAPEQARGEVPTRACDIYSLGATLYTLLSQAPPYRPRDPSGRGGAMDVLLQVRGGPPERLVGPRRLVRIVEKAMNRDPAARYETAGALAADLDRWVADRPTGLDGIRPGLRLALAARRNRETTLALMVLFIALAAFSFQVQRLDERREALLQSVADVEARRVAAEAAEQAALAASRQAEARKLESEAARADAEAEAELAREVQRQAELDRTAAEIAKAAALEGQSVAEALAAAEIRARTDAEQATALADSARRDTQARLDALATRLTESESARMRTETRLSAAEAARADLEHKLSDSVARRIAAETERDIAIAERDRARAELSAREAAQIPVPPTETVPAE